MNNDDIIWAWFLEMLVETGPFATYWLSSRNKSYIKAMHLCMWAEHK